MLILSRKNKESIIIDDRIEVKVVEIDGATGTVKLAVKAPKEVSIHRKEVFDAINTANQEAVVKKKSGAGQVPEVAKALKETRAPFGGE